MNNKIKFEYSDVFLKNYEYCYDFDKYKTDLERFIELYKSFGIECKVNKEDNTLVIYLSQNWQLQYNDGIKYTFSDKFFGYNSFYSAISFTKDGKFINQGFFE